jgi:UDP-N-acetylmuramoylalanine--D-glutamate ligase
VQCAVETAPTLDVAVHRAAGLAMPGGTVLFSPGAPSFDAYANFAQRGEHFARLVRSL